MHQVHKITFKINNLRKFSYVLQCRRCVGLMQGVRRQDVHRHPIAVMLTAREQRERPVRYYPRSQAVCAPVDSFDMTGQHAFPVVKGNRSHARH
jgi:hypothetical protein